MDDDTTSGTPEYATFRNQAPDATPGSLRSAVASAALAAFALGCAGLSPTPPRPVYRTHTDYVMPAAADARSEALQCEEVKYECLQLEESRMERCQLAADDKRDRCWADPNRGPGEKAFYCDRAHENAVRVCDETYRCAQRYDECFERAGGTIQRTNTCVRNCESAT